MDGAGDGGEGDGDEFLFDGLDTALTDAFVAAMSLFVQATAMTKWKSRSTSPRSPLAITDSSAVAACSKAIRARDASPPSSSRRSPSPSSA